MPPPITRYASMRSKFMIAYLGDDPEAPQAVLSAASVIAAALGVEVAVVLPDQWAAPPAIPASQFREARRRHAVVRLLPSCGWERSLTNLLKEAGPGDR